MPAIQFAPMAAQTCAAPSNSATINLGSAIAGRSTFRTWLATGTTMGYQITDGTVWEEGYGTLTHGTPDTLTRTVIRNSAGTTDRIAFAGSATVISFPPSTKVPLLDTLDNLVIPGLGMSGGITFRFGSVSGTTGSLVSGVAEIGVTVTFPVAFPTACLHVFPAVHDVSGSSLQEGASTDPTSFTATQCNIRLFCNQASTAMTGSYLAIGH